jgi:hypothetical protein
LRQQEIERASHLPWQSLCQHQQQQQQQQQQQPEHEANEHYKSEERKIGGRQEKLTVKKRGDEEVAMMFRRETLLVGNEHRAAQYYRKALQLRSAVPYTPGLVNEVQGSPLMTRSSPLQGKFSCSAFLKAVEFVPLELCRYARCSLDMIVSPAAVWLWALSSEPQEGI